MHLDLTKVNNPDGLSPVLLYRRLYLTGDIDDHDARTGDDESSPARKPRRIIGEQEGQNRAVHEAVIAA